MLTREQLEEREGKILAPYAMHSRGTRGRKFVETDHPYRTCFQRDRDRVIHSTAFRRLEYKTQVFVNHEGDHYRTRLTHTTEVSQISRTLARAMGLNEELMEATALAHDVGHPPFGHAGEDALREAMEQHGGFEHNRQSLRVMDVLEQRYPGFSGLNLSYEVRESMFKHTTIHDRPGAEAAHDPLVAEFHPGEGPLLEAEFVNEADSIAYDNHDLDDSLRAGLVSEGDLERVSIWRRARADVARRFANLERDVARVQTVVTLINLMVTDLLETTSRRLVEREIRTLADVRRQTEPLVVFSPEVAETKRELERFLSRNVYRHYRVARMTRRAHRFLKDLCAEYMEHPEQLPPKFQKWGETQGVPRAVCDYIAGMTDRYAQEEYKKLFYPFERV
ncbi:MAG: deoxyguanosinetriphosphate triphosphohydrolase [Planctomycetes bacterium]|nr:deoxyguanosinetriphosphate triphosphohydrolase [Planctomycetota bacterium]